MLDIYIASSDNVLKKKIKSILARGGYAISGSSASAAFLVRGIHQRKIDIILLDTSLPGYVGLDLSNLAAFGNPPILLAGAWLPVYSELIRTGQISSIVIKPITENNLLPTIDIAVASLNEINRLKKELENLNGKIAARKVIEKAKGVLMEKLDVSEQEAFEKIQKESMNQSISMKEVAEIILKNHESYKKK